MIRAEIVLRRIKAPLKVKEEVLILAFFPAIGNLERVAGTGFFGSFELN